MIPVSALIAPGTRVGRYLVERPLAQGGTSALFVARDPDGARVVLKIVPPLIATNSARVRLAREARALSAVHHPGVVRVLGTGDHHDMPWIAMDYVNGVDLKRVIAERGPIRSETAIRYSIQAAEALAAAHRAGVVHRDLKPSNLLVTNEGRIVVVDFGIAKRRAEPRDGDPLTNAREVIGTLAYLSPEQIEHGLADERSDVWALGCVLYEMVVGRPPFGQGGTATTSAILRDEPAFPPYVISVIGDIVSACLRKSSFARIASARDLLVLLRAALEHATSDAALDERRSSSSMRASIRPSTRPSAPPSVNPATALRTGPPSRPPSIPTTRAASSHPAVAVAARPSSMTPTRSSSSIRIGAALGRIKGTALRAGLLWFADVYGEALLARVTAGMSHELRALLRPGDPAFGIMASGWYDTQLIGELLDGLERAASLEDPRELASRLAAAAAYDNVNGVYRALFRLIASPPLLEANAQRVWGTYLDEGTFNVRVLAPGTFEGKVNGWSHHHPSVCAMLRALIEHILRAIGYNGLVVERTQCIDQGDGQCVFHGTWLV